MNKIHNSTKTPISSGVNLGGRQVSASPVAIKEDLLPSTSSSNGGGKEKNTYSSSRPFALLLGEDHLDGIAHTFRVHFAWYLVHARNIDPKRILFCQEMVPLLWRKSTYKPLTLKYPTHNAFKNFITEGKSDRSYATMRRAPWKNRSIDAMISSLIADGVRFADVDKNVKLTLPFSKVGELNSTVGAVIKRNIGMAESMANYSKEGRDILLNIVGSFHFIPLSNILIRYGSKHHLWDVLRGKIKHNGKYSSGELFNEISSKFSLQNLLTKKGINTFTRIPARPSSSKEVEEARNSVSSGKNNISSSAVLFLNNKNLQLGDVDSYKKNVWKICDDLFCEMTWEESLPMEKLESLNDFKAAGLTENKHIFKKFRRGTAITDLFIPTSSDVLKVEPKVNSDVRLAKRNSNIAHMSKNTGLEPSVNKEPEGADGATATAELIDSTKRIGKQAMPVEVVGGGHFKCLPRITPFSFRKASRARNKVSCEQVGL